MRILFLILTVFPCALFAQNPFAGVTFGSKADTIKATAKDVSNKQSWDETEFELVNPPYELFKQFKPAACRLTYFKNRLCSVRCEFARDNFEAIYTNFVAERKVPKDRDWDKAEKSATWYGAFKESSFENILRVYESGTSAVVEYSDETQKKFRFGDLFRGVLPWIILTIVGLFAAYLVFGWLMTSKCPKCKRRKLVPTGKTYTNPEDFNRNLFDNPDIRWDEVYHFRCKNCGFEKDDRYTKWRFGQGD